MDDAARLNACTFRGRIPAAHRNVALRRLLGRLRLARLEDSTQTMRGLLRTEQEEASRNLPDLEDALYEREGGWTPVALDLRRFADAVVAAAPRCQVDVCGMTDEGFALVGVYSRERQAEVRRGDVFVGGAIFAADLEARRCHATARLLRLLCANGVVMPLRVLDRTEAYDRSPSGAIRGDIEKVVGRCFSSDVVARTVHPLASAAAVPLRDPIDALQRYGAALDSGLAEKIQNAFDTAGDRTLYGAFNAFTQVARDMRDLRQRYSLERRAGHLIPRFARLRHPVPQSMAVRRSRLSPFGDPVHP